MNRPWRIARRTFLRGTAASMALPLLDQMWSSDREAYAATPPLRFAAVYVPNGILMQRFTPATTGSNYALTPSLRPLEPIKSEVLVVSDLHNRVAGELPNLHLAGVASFLTAQFPNGRDGVINNHTTVDQVIAQSVRGQTRFNSLELAAEAGGIEGCDGIPCVYGLTLAWANSRTPLKVEVNAQSAFNRIFSDVSTGPNVGDGELEQRTKLRTSVLDVVRSDADRLRARLGTADRLKLEEYFSSVRELETRLMQATGAGTGQMCKPGAVPAKTLDYRANAKAMLDVIALAFQCDITRVVTFMLGAWESSYVFDFLSVRADHHGVSHHGGDSGNWRDLEAINTWEVSQFAYLAEKLKNMKEGDGSVLDHSALLFGSDVSDGDSHSYENMPTLVAGRLGGAINSGRHIRAPEGTPAANLLLGLMRGYGLTDARFGNSTAALNLKA